MSQSIKISLELYDRLSQHAKGFDTPADVIQRLLDYYEKKEGVETISTSTPRTELAGTPEIIYFPSTEQNFKEQLLKTKVAYIRLHKVDGTTELKEWNAQNFRQDSSVNGNLRSGYLRGWRNRGIVKAEISTNKSDFI